MVKYAALALLVALNGGEPTPTPYRYPLGVGVTGGDPIQTPTQPPAGWVYGQSPPPVPEDMSGDLEVAEPTATIPALTPTAPAAVLPYEAGDIEIVARVCEDDNADRRCGLGEGSAAVPVVVLDADTGQRLADGETDTDGRAVLRFPLTTRTRVSVDVPYLGVSLDASPTQRGVDVVLDAFTLPEVLP